MRMRQHLHTITSNMTGFNYIAEVARYTEKLFSDSVDLNFSDCHFFEANMSAPLYCVIARLINRLNKVNASDFHDKIERILRKNHFLEHLGYEAMPDSNKTTIPFKIFKLNADKQFSEYLDYYMKGKGIPDMSVALTKRFRQSLFEIFLNAAIHSHSESGIFACGQFYPKKHRLDFTISDAGIGIRENVRNFTKKKISSVNAIKWVLKEGHTTKTGGPPGGLGLKLIRDFISLNKGKLQIVSAFGYYEFKATEDSCNKMNFSFPGTCVNIEINTNDTNSYYLKSELSSDDIF